MKKDPKDYDRRKPAKQARVSPVSGVAPPVEHQFKPGQSGNPRGTPKSRTNLWRNICLYMEMTNAELAIVRRHRKLTQSQKIALKMVKNATQGQESGAERLARYCVDRDEGKASEHLILDKDDGLSPGECEEIRVVLRKAFDE